jgi:hypothetical protein
MLLANAAAVHMTAARVAAFTLLSILSYLLGSPTQIEDRPSGPHRIQIHAMQKSMLTPPAPHGDRGRQYYDSENRHTQQIKRSMLTRQTPRLLRPAGSSNSA